VAVQTLFAGSARLVTLHIARAAAHGLCPPLFRFTTERWGPRGGAKHKLIVAWTKYWIEWPTIGVYKIAASFFLTALMNKDLKSLPEKFNKRFLLTWLRSLQVGGHIQNHMCTAWQLPLAGRARLCACAIVAVCVPALALSVSSLDAVVTRRLPCSAALLPIPSHTLIPILYHLLAHIKCVLFAAGVAPVRHVRVRVHPHGAPPPVQHIPVHRLGWIPGEPLVRERLLREPLCVWLMMMLRVLCDHRQASC
jgi:hypothetical protein